MRSNHSSIRRARRIRFEQLEPRNMLAVFIPGDYDLNGEVENNDYNVWRAEFGAPPDAPADGNGDGFVDAADYVVFRKNFGKIAPPNAPREISATATGATSIQVSWETVSGATSYSVQRRQPDTETEFTTIAPSVGTTTYTDNTATADTNYEYRVVANSASGSSPGSKTAEATANKANLTAYRPQSMQDPANLVSGPIYDRPTEGGFPGGFPRTAVREQDETSNTLGAGIRINLDDDDQNGTRDAFESGPIAEENDLIEVKVDRLPGQGDLQLIVSTPLEVYYEPDKEMPIPRVDGFTEPLQFTNNFATVFVEWTGSDHGTASLQLFDPGTSTLLDFIQFHSFRSLTVVFGGRTQNPMDTDGDGSIGDLAGQGNREGIFDLAQNLYNTGWDVMAFDATNANTDTVISVAETEIRSAYQNRFISPLEGGTGYAAMGYSWGGGAVHDLIERLTLFDGIPATYAVYVDAVQHGVRSFEAPQDNWPDEAFYLLNIWQPNEAVLGVDLDLGGGPITNPEDMDPFSDLEEIPLPNEGHSSIDDDPFVQQRIQTRLNQNMSR